MDIIAKLRQFMEQKGWTEYRLAKEAGLSQSTIANIFHRQTLPSIPTLQTLCQAFGITLSQFFAEGEAVALSAEQAEVLAAYCRLTPRRQELVAAMLEELQKN